MDLLVDNPVYRNFVSPSYCKELLAEGFTSNTSFYWKGYSNQCLLVSFLFDINGYYKEEAKLADQLCPPEFLYPAYTIQDIELYFPSFMLTSKGTNEFEIALDSMFCCESCIAPRMPDAFAKMMLIGLRKRTLSVKKYKLEEK
jgi:hypothetical protein